MPSWGLTIKINLLLKYYKEIIVNGKAKYFYSEEEYDVYLNGQDKGEDGNKKKK